MTFRIFAVLFPRGNVMWAVAFLITAKSPCLLKTGSPFRYFIIVGLRMFEAARENKRKNREKFFVMGLA